MAPAQGVAVDGRVKVLPQHLRPDFVFAWPSNLVLNNIAAVWQVPPDEEPRLLDVALFLSTPSAPRRS